MGAIVGTPAQAQTATLGAAALPARKARQLHRWLWKHHPKRWSFHADTREWLPRLGQLKFDAGQMNVLENGNIGLALATAQSHGWVIIQPDDPRLGPYANYMQELPVDNGRKAYAPSWRKYALEGGMVFEDTDKEQMRAFLRHLVVSGIVGDISPNIKSYHTRRYEGRVHKAEAASAAQPHNGILMLQAQRQRATLDAMQGKPAAPKRRKSRAKKTPPVEATETHATD